MEKPGRLPGQLTGRSPYLQPVHVMAPKDLIGAMVPVTITGIGTNSLFGVLADTPRIDAQSFRSHRSLNSLRNLPTDNGLVPAASEANDTATTQILLTFDDNRRASTLFGQYGQNLALIERRLGVVADSRGNQVTIEGSRDACERARRVLEGLYEQIKRGHDLSQGDVEGAIRLVIAQGSLFDFDPATSRPAFEEINLRKRPVRARTSGQDAYMRALKRHALVFGTGPAGTGKTWLAVAHAVALFERKEVDRIILSRPAVEAGERLGFLPGDMREKVDPYLRPIYDALFDLMDARIVERAMQIGRDRDRAARFHARPHAVERRRHSRRSAEHDVDADEDVSDTPWRKRPHDRDRRSEPDRSALRPDVGARRGDPAAFGCRRGWPRDVHQGRRGAARAGRAYRRGLRQCGGAARGRHMSTIEPVPLIDVIVEAPQWDTARGAEATVRRALSEAAIAIGTNFKGRALAVLLTDDAAIRRLNAQWRNIDKPTNVLSFPPAPSTVPLTP